MKPDEPILEPSEAVSGNPDPDPVVAPGSVVLRWLRLLLAGNPFFPVSAGLLLLGIHQLSVDPEFLGSESEEPKLIFNFSALELYELLLVGVAVFLARRKTWSDATLLVIIENILVLVPLILVTQAVLIGPLLAWSLCLAGGGLAVGRVAWLKRCFPELNLPMQLLVSGLVILLANLALPFVYRPMMELDVGDWETPSRWIWWLVLPGLQTMAFGLTTTGYAHGPAPGKPWLPLLIFCLWTAGSAVHLWCVGHVSNLAFYPHLAAPLLWMTAWTLRSRCPAMVVAGGKNLRTALSTLPAVMTLAAVTAENSGLFLTLSVLNLAMYGAMYRAHKEPALWHLMVMSAFALVAGMPDDMGRAWLPDYSRVRLVVASLGAYLLWHSLRSRRADLALMGALVAALYPGYLTTTHHPHANFQIGFMYLILHSFRWKEDAGAEADRLRVFGCLSWVMHSLAWTFLLPEKHGWVVFWEAVAVLALYGLRSWITGRGGPWIIPATAGLAFLMQPMLVLWRSMQSFPKGMVALAASFLLFGLGTLLGWAKGRTRNAGILAGKLRGFQPRSDDGCNHELL